MEEFNTYSAADANGETEFEDVLRQLTESLDRGDEILIDTWCKRFPQYEERLRRAFPGLLALTQLGRSDLQSDSLFSKESRPLGDYRIIRELGRGGMGIVYEAEQMSLGRRVAIKVLRFAAMLDEKRLERFRTEARAAAMLDHPNIVGVHSVGCERGIHYFAMSLVEGQSLAEIVRMI
ncbi:MAG: protein kinase, partial [Planctomycetales bacterium]|nr:protein kinase [Planctomycetales bacterium]